MSYNITRTNGEQLYGEEGLPENTTDTIVYKNSETQSGGLVMIGKLIPEYGTDQSNNFLRLLENFSNDVFPDNPVLGMLFYKSDETSLYVCSDELKPTWTKLLAIQFDKSSDPIDGDMWFDKENKKLYIYDSSDDVKDYILIGPSNYKNKEELSAIGETSIFEDTISKTISFEQGTTNLVTARIVASEKMSPSYVANNSGGRKPECASWIYRLLVNNYMLPNGKYISEIIGNPNFELIGRTNGNALNWTIETSIDTNNDLVFTAFGVGTENNNILPEDDKILWEFDIDIVKV